MRCCVVVITGALIETILSMLELPPFALVSVQDTRCDRLKGQCKISNKATFESDRVLSALLEASYSGRDSGHIHTLQQYQQSSNLEFDLSLLELSLKLNIPTDQLSQMLYEHQCNGHIIYAMTDSSLYVRVASSEPGGAEEMSVSGEAISRTNQWMWEVARTLHRQHISRCDDTSKKLLDMWRLGLVIASGSPQKRHDAKAQASSAMRTRSEQEDEDDALGLGDESARQRHVMDFISHYLEVMSVVAPSKESSPSPTELTYTEDHVRLLRDQFDQIPLPFAVQHKYVKQEDDANSLANKIVRSLAVLLRDPNIGEVVSGLGQASNLDLLSPLGRRMKNNALILYAIRVLFGLSSLKIQSTEWKGRAGWLVGTHASFEYLWSSGEFLLNQKSSS
jgi:hypothetical protein